MTSWTDILQKVFAMVAELPAGNECFFLKKKQQPRDLPDGTPNKGIPVLPQFLIDFRGGIPG